MSNPSPKTPGRNASYSSVVSAPTTGLSLFDGVTNHGDTRRLTLVCGSAVQGHVRYRGLKMQAAVTVRNVGSARIQLDITTDPASMECVACEIAALLSIYVGHRVELPRSWRKWPNPCRTHAASLKRHSDNAQAPSIGGFAAWLDEISVLSPTRQLDFARACERYRRALWESDIHYELAYLDLITAAEIVAKRIRTDESSFDTDFPILSGMIGMTADSNQREELARMRLKLTEHSQLKAKFIRFLTESADEGFWQGRNLGELGRDTRTRLPTRISAVYDARCRRLHDRIGFPQVQRVGDVGGAYRGVYLALMRSSRPHLPTLGFFADLVRYSLLRLPGKGTRERHLPHVRPAGPEPADR
jgi:hypothetical protein